MFTLADTSSRNVVQRSVDSSHKRAVCWAQRNQRLVGCELLKRDNDIVNNSWVIMRVRIHGKESVEVIESLMNYTCRKDRKQTETLSVQCDAVGEMVVVATSNGRD